MIFLLVDCWINNGIEVIVWLKITDKISVFGVLDLEIEVVIDSLEIVLVDFLIKQNLANFPDKRCIKLAFFSNSIQRSYMNST